MTAQRFGERPTSERLALVEQHLRDQDERSSQRDEKLDAIDSKVDGLRSDFTELRIELAKKRSAKKAGLNVATKPTIVVNGKVLP